MDTALLSPPAPIRRHPVRSSVGAAGVLLSVAVVLAWIAASATASPAGVHGAIAPVPPLHVAVVGDSLIFTTSAGQRAELSGRGYAATVDGNPGKPLTDPWVQGRLGDSRGADIVVIATASNDNLQLARRADQVGLPQAAHEYAAALADTLGRLGARCTVVVDVRETSSALYRPDTASVTNAALREVAATRPAAVVVPWSTMSAGHDHGDWFVDDELHFVDDTRHQDAGVAAYADAVADGVDGCRSLLSDRP